MHELSITRSIVAICVENANGARVTGVTLEIGKLSGVMAEAVRFCFDICAKDTSLEGATLEVIETPGLARCCNCGGEFALVALFGRCACGSADLDVVAGKDLKVKQMEVEECVQPADVLRRRA